MSERDDEAPSFSSSPPLPAIERGVSRWLPSSVWLLPLLAAVFGLGLLIRDYVQQGPVVVVSFSTAEGIVPGMTKVKFKNIDIGQATHVALSPERDRAVVTIELEREATAFAVEGSRFWVVRPRLQGATVSGLGTVLSGAYIGVDGGESKTAKYDFVGLENPPVILSDAPGRQYILSTENIGSLDAGSPLFFRRIEVGYVVDFALQPDGRKVDLTVFVKAPYDRFITANTRFWHAGGIGMSIGADGLKIQAQSLISILSGGIAFETPLAAGGPGEAAAEGTHFALAENRDEALRAPDAESVTAVFLFPQTVRGLSAGAPVDFRGLQIGAVRSVEVIYLPDLWEFRGQVVAELFPGRLKLEDGASLRERLGESRDKFLTEMIDKGLRAQMRLGSMLTGQLYVALDFFPDAPPAQPRYNRVEAVEGQTVLFEIPTHPGSFDELQTQIAALLAKLEAIPVEQIGKDVQTTLVQMEKALLQLEKTLEAADRTLIPEAARTAAEMRQAVEALNETLAGDSPVQQDARKVLLDLGAAAQSLKALLERLDQAPESLVRGRKAGEP